MEKWKPNERVIHFIKLELPQAFRAILSTTQLNISASIANKAIAKMINSCRENNLD
ncbi:hypothetical protein [Zooshikella ganghwensis]|uniref:hypothetical protein n=1 Tax=Zooshikella ganghwensis TaxID=202772 RepID=UPI00041FA8B6|nr:hypothetical protein [Zooshikella ganghwensis]